MALSSQTRIYSAVDTEFKCTRCRDMTRTGEAQSTCCSHSPTHSPSATRRHRRRPSQLSNLFGVGPNKCVHWCWCRFIRTDPAYNDMTHTHTPLSHTNKRCPRTMIFFSQLTIAQPKPATIIIPPPSSSSSRKRLMYRPRAVGTLPCHAIDVAICPDHFSFVCTLNRPNPSALCRLSRWPIAIQSKTQHRAEHRAHANDFILYFIYFIFTPVGPAHRARQSPAVLGAQHRTHMLCMLVYMVCGGQKRLASYQTTRGETIERHV